MDGGLTLRYTDHDQPIVFLEAGGSPQTYSPFFGIQASARQLVDALKEANVDVFGIINSDQVSHEDLRAGRFDRATVVEELVDWRTPSQGSWRTRTYTIGRVKFTGETWEAEMNGLPNKLLAKQGRIKARNCDAEFGDGRCGLTKSSHTVNGVRVLAASQDAAEPRRIYRAVLSDVPSQSDGFYDYGELVWQSGQNGTHGVTSQVKVYLNANRDIELYEPTPFAILDSETFDLVTGCDLLFSTCRDKFSNAVNFRGFHLMPGSDKVLKTPGTKN